MNESEDQKPTEFRISVPTHDRVALLAEMLLNVPAQLDALAVLAFELHAKVFAADLTQTAQRYERLKQDFHLKRAFYLQDKPAAPESTEERT
jgi:hypothetical protein